MTIYPKTPRVRNRYLWFYGADDGSTGYEVILEQHAVETEAKEFHTLFKIEPGGDATAIGMMVGKLTMGGGLAGAEVYLTDKDPRL